MCTRYNTNSRTYINLSRIICSCGNFRPINVIMNNRRRELIQSTLPQNAIRTSLMVTSSRNKLLMIVRSWQSKSNRKIVTADETRAVNWKLLVATKIDPSTDSFVYHTHALRTRICPRARIDLSASGSRADCGGNNVRVILRSAARTHRSGVIAIRSATTGMVRLNKCKCMERDGSEAASHVAENLDGSFTDLYITHPGGSTRGCTRGCTRKLLDLCVPQNTMSTVRVIVRDALRDQVITDIKQLRCNDRANGGSSVPRHDRKSMPVEIRNIKLEPSREPSYCRNHLVIVAIRSIGELPPIVWCIAFSENVSGCCNVAGLDNHGESGNLIARESQGRCGCSSSQSDRDILVRSMLLSGE